MDNYEVAINGTILAAQILGIEAPEVQFFYNQNYSKRGINSVFLKEKYIIAFNEEWIKQASPLEIQITCFHETRHAFQWKCINGEYLGSRKISSEIVDIWNSEMNNYKQPTSDEIPEEFYLKQKIEIDAIAFAHYQMNKLFEVKTFIPKMIYQEVKNRIDILIDIDLTTQGGLK
jgi:hypothetical protein